MNENPNDIITVCDKCKTSLCWQGILMCYENQTAGTVEKTRAELIELGVEHPSNFKTNQELAG